MDVCKKELVIIYASETGNCEDIAKRMLWEAERRKLLAIAYSITDFPIEHLISERYLVFICSTTGQGQVPSSMRKFWSFIMKKSLPHQILSSLNIGVIGLGDSSYSKYNIIAKKLFKRLIQLGAHPLLDIALGDDQHDLGYGAAVDPWLKNFWLIICQLKEIPVPPIDKRQLPPKSFKYIKTSGDLDLESTHNMIKGDQLFNQWNPYLSRVISNERATSLDHFQEVRYVKLEFNPAFYLTYQPGDVVMICPQNSPSDVDNFIKLFKLDPNEKFILKKEDTSCSIQNAYHHLPQPCTIKQLVRDYLDIHSVPKRSFFELLWKFSDDPIEAEKLQEFASTEGQQELYSYCYQPKRTILEILLDFPQTSAKIQFDYIFDLIPPMRSRPYSIASSLTHHPEEISILVVVVNYKTRLKKNRLGLCSNYIQRLKTDDNVRLWLKQGEFKLPSKQCPYIMVAPGTGVAPFRSIIEHRISQNIKDNYLFFGCRYSTKDFYFKDQWSKYESNNLIKLFTAFSRENANQRTYVQDVMLQKGELILKLVQNGAIILIAGSSKNMPQDVRDTIVKIIQQQNKEEAEKVVNKMELTNYIQYDCW